MLALRAGMALACQQARQAFHAGEVPVGAIVEHEGEIIASAFNQVETLGQSTAHAEMLALQAAQHTLGRKWLFDCRLFVTLEPCPMCAGAISLARIACLVYGAYDPKSGGVDHGARVFDHPQCHHKPQVISGIEEQDCAQLLSAFFQQRRELS